jgi:hypothetical protein
MRDKPSNTWNRGSLISIASTKSKWATDGSMLGTACNPESVDDVPISFLYSTMASENQFDLPYMVEQWDDTDSHVQELIALTGDYRVARAAHEEAVKRRPGRIVTLRQKNTFAGR